MRVRLADIAPGLPEAVSGWIAVPQERVDAFAEATEDRQWIHVDPARARAESPYGGPVAHGFLTLALIPRLRNLAIQFEDLATSVNYGLNRVRFPAPVPAGARVRARFAVKSVEPRGAGILVTWDVTIECDAHDRPCCIAEFLNLYEGTA